MQSKLFFLTLAFVFSISFALSQSLAPLDTIELDTAHVIDNVPQWNWDKSPDTPISIEDDFSAEPIRSPLTPSRIGFPQGILFRIFVHMIE